VATGPTLEDVRRSDVVKIIATAVVTTAAILVLYYVMPVPPPRGSPLAQMIVGITLFGVVFGYEVRAILRSKRPIKRAARAAAVIIPLFIVIFAWIYLSMSHSNPAAFDETLSRTQGLYFAVTVLSTVGFGDITPKIDSARAIQMVLDLVILALVAKMILGAVGRRSAELRSTDEPSGGTPEAPER
jgi:ABC-type transport system involved in multi-copper enzyme maturation permease subunit